jgi:hypothetical protein
MHLLTVALVGLFLTAPTLVTAKVKLRVLLNNGAPFPESQMCTDSEIDFIDQTIMAAASENRRRTLRGDNNEDKSDRTLWLARCANDCRGFTRGTCYVSGCYGYRRDMQEATLQKTCSTHMLNVNAALDALMAPESVLTEACRSTLTVNRDVACYDDVIFGVVENIRLLDGTTSAVLHEKFASGSEICVNSPFSFEVIANACVEKVAFSFMRGVSQQSMTTLEKTFPFSLASTELPKETGKHYLILTPDNDTTKTMQLEFSIVKC